MSIKITNNDGNGHIEGKSIFQYSFSEDVTSLEPGNLSGGTGQLTFSAIAITNETSELLHHNSKLMINNEITLSDTSRGEIIAQVKKIGVSSTGVASVTGDTIQWRLNVIKTAAPHGGAGKNLLTAIEYYCELVNITPVIAEAFASDLSIIPVNFIGWTGNVWEYLKMLCSAVSASLTDNIGIEMFVSGNDLHFREAKATTQNIARYEADSSISVDVFDAALGVDVYNYNTSYGTNKVVYEESNYSSTIAPADRFRSSISDTFQVNAGDTVIKRFKIDASLETVNQPVCVETITRTPPSPYAGTTGEYVIVGTDDLPIKPSQWNALGGLVAVATTENPNEIEITVTAPPADSIEKANGTGQGLAPYKIGIESSGDGDYPAFWITGTGVFFDKKLQRFTTGASDLYTPRDSAATIDNPFITNSRDASSRGVAAAQVACGPAISMTQSLPTDVPFNVMIGTTQLMHDNRYRVTSASYTESNVTLTSVPSTSFTDFNNAWSDDTFANFTETALDPEVVGNRALKFNEFTIVPLMDVHTV